MGWISELTWAAATLVWVDGRSKSKRGIQEGSGGAQEECRGGARRGRSEVGAFDKHRTISTSMAKAE